MSLEGGGVGLGGSVPLGRGHATLVLLPVKYSHDQAYEFLGGPQYPQTNGVINLVFCVISRGSRVSVL